MNVTCSLRIGIAYAPSEDTSVPSTAPGTPEIIGTIASPVAKACGSSGTANVTRRPLRASKETVRSPVTSTTRTPRVVTSSLEMYVVTAYRPSGTVAEPPAARPYAAPVRTSTSRPAEATSPPKVSRVRSRTAFPSAAWAGWAGWAGSARASRAAAATAA